VLKKTTLSYYATAALLCFSPFPVIGFFCFRFDSFFRSLPVVQQQHWWPYRLMKKKHKVCRIRSRRQCE